MEGFDQSEFSKDPTQVFDVLEKLGEGSYGAVLKARHKASGKIYAVKSVVFYFSFHLFLVMI